MNITEHLQNLPITTQFIGFGENSIYNTVDKIHEIVKISSSNPYVRKWAEKIIENVPAKDKIGEVSAIHDFVKWKVRYTKDPLGMEYIQTPLVLLKAIELGEMPFGDCDDMSTLSLSLYRSIGYPVATKVTSYSPNKKYSHIYGLVNVGGRWLPSDTTMSSHSIGWEAPQMTKVYEKVI
jgi:transglutaminase-like putative cysteine protease